MAFNGSGTFNRIYSWVTDAANGLAISSARMDTETDGIATGLSNCVTKDGQTTITANLPMSGFNHTGVGDSDARTEYPATGQVQDQAFTWCNTSGGTANAHTLTPTPAITAYADGQAFEFLPVATNTSGTVTIANSGLATRAVKKSIGGALVVLSLGDLIINVPARVVDDGTQYVLQNPAPMGHGADVASVAGTVVLDTVTGGIVDITGAEVITAITLAEGRIVRVRAAGAFTLTHGASLVCPSSANIACAAGDQFDVAGYASGVVRIFNYQRLNGTPVGGASFKVGSFTRDISTASGSQAVTGFGFKPKSIIFLANVNATVQASWGVSDASTHLAVHANDGGVAGQFSTTANGVYILATAGNAYGGTVTSFDSDGFTMAWTKTGSPTGTATIIYLAIR